MPAQTSADRPVEGQKQRDRDARQACGDTAGQSHAVDVAVAEHEQVGMRLHQAEGMAEARPAAQQSHPFVVGEPPSKDEEQRVAEKGACRGHGKGAPRFEKPLMGEEAAEDGKALAFGHAADEDGEKPEALDEVVKGFDHRAGD